MSGCIVNGYIQLRHKPYRGKYLHRLVLAEACQEFCYWPLGPDGIPEGFEVHHMDFDKQHNCRGNLILMPHDFHYHAHAPDREKVLGVAAIPEGYKAVTEDFCCASCGHVRRVPLAIYTEDEVPDWMTD